MQKQLKKLKRIFSGRRSRDILPDYITVGRHTYGFSRNVVAGMSPEAPIDVGSFCSIGPDVIIFGKADHPIDLPSTFPLRTLMYQSSHHLTDGATRGGVTIGNDVWIGARAMVMSGISVGDGAVIGAGAVVTKDVPSYAVAVGVPANVIKFRFSPDQVEAMREIAWWNWSDERIQAMDCEFYGSIDDFIAAARKT
jgi:acetyltransferase-like isoleucine patch superfamily enzyme